MTNCVADTNHQVSPPSKLVFCELLNSRIGEVLIAEGKDSCLSCFDLLGFRDGIESRADDINYVTVDDSMEITLNIGREQGIAPVPLCILAN
jgi:hypothetical protein